MQVVSEIVFLANGQLKRLLKISKIAEFGCVVVKYREYSHVKVAKLCLEKPTTF